MNSIRLQFGLLRSLLIYYGVPLRGRHMARFYGQFIGPGDLCFDIGAHVGNRLRAWASLGARVVGVEPQPHCMALLRRLYGRHPRITLVEEALGAEPSVGHMFISRRNPTVSSLSQQWIEAVQRVDSFAGVRWDGEVTVSVTTLDRLIDRFGRPRFCKIDVEGYELEVLRGLSQPLPALSVEYIPAAIDIAIDCLRRLQQLGNYEFNWALGETHRFQSCGWLSLQEMMARLNEMPAGRGSGDLYARLRPGV